MVWFFLLIVVGSLGFMVVDGLLTGSVWVRGARKGMTFKQWAHKRDRDEEPISYWLFMSLYIAGIVWILYLGFKM